MHVRGLLLLIFQNAVFGMMLIVLFTESHQIQFHFFDPIERIFREPAMSGNQVCDHAENPHLKAKQQQNST